MIDPRAIAEMMTRDLARKALWLLLIGAAVGVTAVLAMCAVTP